MFGWSSFASVRRFRPEALHQIVTGRPLGPEHLEGDRPVERHVNGAVDVPHVAAAQMELDEVLAQCLSHHQITFTSRVIGTTCCNAGSLVSRRAATVMLSKPPRERASATRPWQSAVSSSCRAAASRISSSSTRSVSPSEHNTNTSSIADGKGLGPAGDLDGGVRAQGAQNHVPFVVLARVLFPKGAFFDQFRDRRVVDRHLVDASATDQIQSAVADAGDRRFVFAQRQRDRRRPHAEQPLLLLRLPEDLAVGGVERRFERLADRTLARVIRPVNDLHSQPARDFSGGVPAHAVCDDRQNTAALEHTGVGGPDDDSAVLVDVALAADVGHHGRTDGERHGDGVLLRSIRSMDVLSLAVIDTWVRTGS